MTVNKLYGLKKYFLNLTQLFGTNKNSQFSVNIGQKQLQ